MITEDNIRKILRERYGCNTGKLKLDFEELQKSFKLFHKYLSGIYNTSIDGSSVISSKYRSAMDKSGGEIKTISECIEVV